MTRGLSRYIVAYGGLLLQASMGTRLAWEEYVLLEQFWLHAFGRLLDKFRLLSRSVDFQLLSSQADSSCLAWRDALDG